MVLDLKNDIIIDSTQSARAFLFFLLSAPILLLLYFDPALLLSLGLTLMRHHKLSQSQEGFLHIASGLRARLYVLDVVLLAHCCNLLGTYLSVFG